MDLGTTDQGATADVLALLRTTTRDVHQRLHSHPLTRNLVRRSLSMPEYVLILHALHRYHAMVETELRNLPFVYLSQLASTRLQRDYHEISGDPVNPLPVCPPLNLACSVDSALGLLYVLEGSRQGGNIIASNVKKTLGLGEGHGASFYAGDNQSVSSDWDNFIELLKDRCSDPIECSVAAHKAFLQLESYLWSIHTDLRTNVMQLHSA